ncbi:NAD(P)/FAD-dependent oxidoreductase [Shewanella acanthi]|uniref:NAD(P)/FAD-dependent oxidoreductase n=1 Tax=Shewanella acanthi TaxID=2864212 RepID=UPI001C65D8DE|nr:FAD-dependent oxidoreductase [Shewanella acanthi]QYJ78156.1 FAD-binding oxidoreductase [Shewanella acanthi]
MTERGFWFDTEPELQARSVSAPIEQEIDVDVAIIGAGYSGLWTAYYLKQYRPQLSVAILEANTVGQGASGRNGGWLMGSFSGDVNYLNKLDGEPRQLAKAIIQDTIHEVSRVCQAQGIDCDLHHGGNLRVAARYPEQHQTIKHELSYWREQGFTEADIRWLDKAELDNQVKMAKGQAALFTPHCARIHPAKLVCGLADTVKRLGVKIYENSAVVGIRHNSAGSTQLRTAKGRITSRIYIPALEGYQREFGELARYSLPVQSLLIATEPLTYAQWQSIGLDNRPTFSDASRIVTYGQRTPDNRLIFGARGGYQFGGKIRTEFGFNATEFNVKHPSQSQADFRFRHRLLLALFPQLEGVNITHGWGGTLAIARDFAPHAVFDPHSGLGFIGGYGGEGVGAANLFARTLVDLILERKTLLSTMPWAFKTDVKKVLKPWESEPFRYLGYHSMNRVFAWEDRLYSRGESSTWQRKLAKGLADRLEGMMS